ncbi:hypothetical protein ACWD3Z_05335 [Streptomyces sp. NPDC002740]
MTKHAPTALRQLIRAAVQNMIPGGTLAAMDVEIVETIQPDHVDGVRQARHTWSGSALEFADRIAQAFPTADSRAAGDVEAAVREQGALPAPGGDEPTFFRPGRIYTRDLPFRAPEDRPSFECVGIGWHPSKDALRAFGFEQPGAGFPWVSASQRTQEWEEGWIDLGPTTPDRLTQTFAPTQALQEDDDA